MTPVSRLSRPSTSELGRVFGVTDVTRNCRQAPLRTAHATTILVAGWMQGIGSVLNVVFARGLVQLTGARDKLSGKLTLLSGATLVCVSTGGVQHIFLIAPALLLPLGWTLLDGRVLPGVFGLTGLVLRGRAGNASKASGHHTMRFGAGTR